jgi:hypothetical protein
MTKDLRQPYVAIFERDASVSDQPNANAEPHPLVVWADCGDEVQAAPFVRFP